MAGKGSFVAQQNPELLREEHLRIVESYLQQAVDTARASGVSLTELRDMLGLLYGDEY